MYTLDRFARNRYDSAIYKAKLKRNGVKIFYAKQPMPDTPEGIILESVLEGYAEYYSENLARSIKRGMKENALHGIAMGSPVLGYKIGNDRQYEIDPVGAKAVRTIFTMYAEGKSKTQIVNWLNEHGFKTSRGNAFNKNSLSRILRNDKYIGVYRYDDVVLEDAVPPIIDKTLFDKVQATFRHNYTARAKAKAIEDYLLTTKVFCGHCGEPMVGESGTSKTGKVHHYYKCVNRKRKHNCEKKVEKKEWLERTVVEFTVQQVLTDENIEKISIRAMELIEKELQDTSVLIGLQERLKETNKRIKNLMSAIEQGIITPTTKERLEELEEERRDLEGQIAREEMKKPLLTKERIMYWLESFKRGDIEDVEYQRRIIDTLVNSVYVYDDGDKGRKLVLTFNISGNNTLTISSSDIERAAPALVLAVVYGILPKPAALLTAFISGASAFGVLWFVEPISYFPVVGAAGTYMAFLSGNISNMRIPCASMAQVAADVEPGTEKGSVVATLGMAVSIVINVSVLTIGAILGTSVLSMLPDTIKAALNYLLPALFGALLVQFGMKMKKHSVIMVVFAIILYFMIGMGYFNWLPGASNWLGTLGCVFVSIAVGMATLKNTTKE